MIGNIILKKVRLDLKPKAISQKRTYEDFQSNFQHDKKHEF